MEIRQSLKYDFLSDMYNSVCSLFDEYTKVKGITGKEQQPFIEKSIANLYEEIKMFDCGDLFVSQVNHFYQRCGMLDLMIIRLLK